MTEAMRDWLFENWNIDARVVYDKPPMFFKPTSVLEKHDLFLRLGNTLFKVY